MAHTEKTLIPEDLGDMIIKEAETLLNKGLPDKKAIRLGTLAAIRKWREKNADKSGG